MTSPPSPDPFRAPHWLVGGHAQTVWPYGLRRHQVRLRRERVIVGLNSFATESEPVPIAKLDPKLEQEQVARTRALRARRDAARYASALEALERAARGSDNLMPPIVAAVKALATVGEIADVLRGVFGEHVETVTV